MKEEQMQVIAGFIASILKDIRNEGKVREIRDAVQDLCGQFPLYPERLAKGDF
jgi:glycine/serine hydroxymethyltransferase